MLIHRVMAVGAALLGLLAGACSSGPSGPKIDFTDQVIVAFGDSDFASNRSLRTLYNADLALNAVHWAVEREAAIKILPKIRSTVQFPLPVENTLQTLYGVGLLVPELLLAAGALVWLRRRSA